jgi:hypothetical protein
MARLTERPLLFAGAVCDLVEVPLLNRTRNDRQSSRFRSRVHSVYTVLSLPRHYETLL